MATTGQGLLGNNMFAYCNNSPINCVDSSGCLPIRNTMLMISDGGLGVQGRAAESEIILENQPDNVKHFLDPAIIVSFPIKSGVDVSGSVGVSLSHGELNPDGDVSITTDMGLLEIGQNVGYHGISFEHGFYFVKDSVSFRIKNKKEEYLPFRIEVSGSVGWGKTAKFTEDGFEIGISEVLGMSFAIMWDGASATYYLDSLFD